MKGACAPFIRFDGRSDVFLLLPKQKNREAGEERILEASQDLARYLFERSEEKYRQGVQIL